MEIQQDLEEILQCFPMETGTKNEPTKFHLKSSYVMKDTHGTDGCYKWGKLNLIGGFLPLLVRIGCSLL